MSGIGSTSVAHAVAQRCRGRSGCRRSAMQGPQSASLREPAHRARDRAAATAPFPAAAGMSSAPPVPAGYARPASPRCAGAAGENARQGAPRSCRCRTSLPRRLPLRCRQARRRARAPRPMPRHAPPHRIRAAPARVPQKRIPALRRGRRGPGRRRSAAPRCPGRAPRGSRPAPRRRRNPPRPRGRRAGHLRPRRCSARFPCWRPGSRALPARPRAPARRPPAGRRIGSGGERAQRQARRRAGHP